MNYIEEWRAQNFLPTENEAPFVQARGVKRHKCAYTYLIQISTILVKCFLSLDKKLTKISPIGPVAMSHDIVLRLQSSFRLVLAS